MEENKPFFFFGFPIVQEKGRERSKEEIMVWITCMETICVWNICMGTICMEIPPCLDLGRKNPNQSVFLGCLKFVLRLVRFWLNDFW